MRRFVLIASTIFLLNTIACNRMGPAKPYEVVGNTPATVQRAFNADVGKVRVLMLVSPTCGTCLQGTSEVSEQIAKIDRGRDIPVYVVWLPRRGGREKDVPAATRVVVGSSELSPMPDFLYRDTI